MKVSVATQLFSHSVAAALTYLRKIKLKRFENSKPNSDFVLLMNDLFDMLTSKSKFGKRTKQPIESDNLNETENSLCEAISFLKTLKDTNDIPLIQGPRTANSILAISRNLLDRQEAPFEYIITYRFS